MSTRELKILLDAVPDTFEIVLRDGRTAHGRSPERQAWHDARDEAAHALRAWRAAPGRRGAYLAYRAAQDREDAAQDALVPALP
jgi:hypothetical protein